MRDISSDDYEPKKRNGGCQCRHMDMPGSCPGPRNCPMVETKYLVTCNGPTGRLLASEWVHGEDAAEDMVKQMTVDWPGLVCIGYRSEQQIEDGE